MRLFRKRRKKQPNIFLEEDRARRALARGDFDPNTVTKLLCLARERGKPRDLALIHQALHHAGHLGLFDGRELDNALAQDRYLRELWAKKGENGIRIALYHAHDWHARLCEDVAELLGEQLILKTGDEEELVSARPDAVISSYIGPDKVTRMRARIPETFWLYLRHGIANKKSSFGIAGAFDAVCVSSQYVADFYCHTGFFPKKDIWITGYPPIDGLARRVGKRQTDVPTVLYAPTFNRNLSSADAFGTDLLKHILAAEPTLRLIVKLHPETFNFDRKVWDRWAGACSKNERAMFVEDRDADLLSLFDRADILMSDFSSTAFLFLATGRPAVFLTPKGASDAHDWNDPDGIEWKWRDMAEEVHDINGLTPVLRKILDGRDDYAEVRAQRRRMLFGDTLDGNSAARVMQGLGRIFGHGID